MIDLLFAALDGFLTGAAIGAGVAIGLWLARARITIVVLGEGTN